MKQTQKDLLYLINQIVSKIVPLYITEQKITSKLYSDGTIFMQILQIVDRKYFNSCSLTKGDLSQRNKFMCQIQKVKNWKQIIRQIKQYFIGQYNKGIKYGDIDIIELCSKNSLCQLKKCVQLLLCVIVNNNNKQKYISNMMQLSEQTQQKLAYLIQQSIQNRLCSLQQFDRHQLNQQIQSNKLQILSLYDQISKLTQIKKQLEYKVQQYEIQNQKQKIIRYKKNNNFNNLIYLNNQSQQSLNWNKLHSQICLKSNKNIDNEHYDKYKYQDQIIQAQNYHQFQQNSYNNIILKSNNNINMGSYNNINLNQYKNGQNNIIDNLKKKIINLQDQYEKQIQQLQDKIQQLQNKSKQSSHFQQLMIIYQQKYQQSLTQIDKITQYQKEKRKITQEIAQKNYIIQQLKSNHQEINKRLIQMEQQKIDLQLTLAKKNNQNRINNKNKSKLNNNNNQNNLNNNNNKNNSNNNNNNNNNNNIQNNLNYHNNSNQTKKTKTSSQLRGEQIIFYNIQQKNQLIQLQIKQQSQYRQIKRLQRRQRQLLKENKILKQKIVRLKIVQTQNSKLSNIIIQLHTQKNQQIQLLTSIIYQTYKQFQYKFKRLINKSQNQNQNSNSNVNDYLLVNFNHNMNQVNHIDNKQNYMNQANHINIKQNQQNYTNNQQNHTNYQQNHTNYQQNYTNNQINHVNLQINYNKVPQQINIKGNQNQIINNQIIQNYIKNKPIQIQTSQSNRKSNFTKSKFNQISKNKFNQISKNKFNQISKSKLNQISNFTHKKQRSISKKTSIFKGTNKQKQYHQNKCQLIKQVQFDNEN